MNYSKMCMIEMPSVTLAMKAQRLLMSKGYYCEVQRISKTRSMGCAFNIYVNEDEDKIKKIFKDNQITYKSSEG